MQRLKPLVTFIGYGIFFVLLLFGYSARATLDVSSFPQLTGHIVDTAHILDDDTHNDIATFLAAHEQATSDQIVVVTIPTLDGENEKEYATALFRHWGLGQKDKDNGVLLLFVMNDHKMRIEVGYGLESKLTDVKSKLIIDDILTPAFKAENYGSGIKLATQEIVSILGSQQKYALYSQVPENIVFPEYKNYFTDNLNLLDATETAKINEFLGNLDRATQTKIAVVSQGSIGRVDPIAYVSALFQYWQLRNSDMLIVIAQQNILDRPKDDESLKHLISVKVGKDLQKLVPIDKRYKIIDTLKVSSRADDFTFSLKEVLQKSTDAIDQQQNYEHLLYPTNVLPAVIVAGVLSVIFVVAIVKAPTDSLLRLVVILFFIASVLALLSYAYFYFDDEPDYLADGLSVNFALYFAACMIIAIPINLLRKFVIDLFSEKPGISGYTGGSSRTYYSDSSSSSSSDSYSGGGGSSGGGGASGSW